MTGDPNNPLAGRWRRLREAAVALWNEYTWITRGATLLLVAACLYGMALAAQGDSFCAASGPWCWVPASLQRALASDAFRTLVTLAIALFIAIHLKERQIEGKLDGSQHYDIGRALAYGYFCNFLVPALLIVQSEGRGRHLQVIRPADVDELERFSTKIWPRIKSMVSVKSLAGAYQSRTDAPLRRSMLVMASRGGPTPGEQGYFDFPSTLFTLHDYYKTWNHWLREQHKAEISPERIRELQQRQIVAFFQHLRELSRSEVGLEAVREFGLTDRKSVV